MDKMQRPPRRKRLAAAGQAPVPVCAGFGIRSHQQVAALAPHVDGVIVGSALIEAMEQGASTVELLRKLRG